MPALFKAVSLVFGLLGSASAANSQVCADASQYVGSNILATGQASPKTCDQGAALFGLAALTLDATSCTATVDDALKGEGKISRTRVFALIGASCCTDKKTACDQYLMNPCATPANFDGTKSVTPPGGEAQSCAMMQGVMPAFTASATTCNEVGEENGATRQQVLSMLSGCCTSGGNSCAAFSLNPCKVSTEFKATQSVTWDMTCTTVFAMKSTFVADTVTCGLPAFIGETKTNAEFLASMVACCGAGGQICDNPPTPAPSTSVSSARRTQLAQLLVIGTVSTLARALV